MNSQLVISRATRAIETLQAPGRGLLTISTAAADPEKSFAQYFTKGVYQSRPTTWQPQYKNPKLPIVLGYPCDTGSGIVRGSAYGPIAIREALYKKMPALAANDFGDVPVIPNLLHDSMLNNAQIQRSAAYLYAQTPTAAPVSPLSLLEEIIAQILEQNPLAKTLVIGGDHSMAGAILRGYARQNKLSKTAILQIDAHTDLLDERFGIEHCFATWSAHTARSIANPAALVQVGLRSSRYAKAHWEKAFGVKQFWSSEVRTKSPSKFADSLLKHWQNLDCERLYISNDIDGTDSNEAPSTGTPEPKGLRSAWVCELFAALAGRIEVIGYDVVEVAPVLGSPSAQKKTVRCARDQTLAALEALKLA